jgi:Rrf2 family iron-sulfur cluster assembly transcriptional regulator
MIDVALHEADWPIRLADISARQQITPAYLEQLAGKLRQFGLLQSTRGPNGGYQLSRPAALISLADILQAADEDLDVTRCGGTSDCQNGQRCLTHGLWAELNQEIARFLGGISLRDMCQKTEIRRIAARQDAAFAQQDAVMALEEELV